MPTDSEVSMKRIVGRGLNGASREVCSVALDADSLVARGHVDGGAAACAYQLKASTDGTSTELEVQVSDRELVVRLSDGEWVVDGVARPDLAAAREVDISATPLTNTLPIRRLRLAVGDAADIIAAYISVAELAVSPHPQRYTRIGPREYLYESRDSDFRRVVTVDDDGIVLDYPGLFALEGEVSRADERTDH